MKSAISVANMMWQTQEILHKKNNPVVPGGLLLIAGSLVVYQHMMNEGHPVGDNLRTFLAMILVQMLPLVALEVKIMSCADPVGLFCKFAVPVTMIHAMFLSMRFCTPSEYDKTYLWCSGAGLAGALLTAYKGFHWSQSSIFQLKSVLSLTILCILGACFTEVLDSYLKSSAVYHRLAAGNFGKLPWEQLITSVITTSSTYLEIMAFVPAVWMVYNEDKNSEHHGEQLDTKRTATAFFLFLVGFYLSEDLLNSHVAWEISGLATAAHLLHFALLLDFACYILAHIYNPEKLLGGLRKFLPMDLTYDV